MKGTVAKQGLGGRLIGNLITSLHLTAASIRLVGQHKIVLVLPACTLAAVAALVVLPLSLLVWGLQHHPEPTGDFFEALYFVTVAAARAGNWSLAVTAALIETYLIFSLWMIPVLTAVLYWTSPPNRSSDSRRTCAPRSDSRTGTWAGCSLSPPSTRPSTPGVATSCSSGSASSRS